MTLIYEAEDGKTLTAAEVCRRLGVPRRDMPFRYVEPILERQPVLEFGALPPTELTIRNRYYQLRRVSEGTVRTA